MTERIKLADAKRDIADAFEGWQSHANALSDSGAWKEAREAELRTDAFLERAEADLIDSIVLATDEALIAELRQRLPSMLPGSRLDVFDALAADFCIQCGDPKVDGVCHCMNDE